MGQKIDPNAWMLTFSDLITLLLTFFVLLLTMKNMDTEPYRETFGVMTDTFVVLEGGAGTLIQPLHDQLRLPTEFKSRLGVSPLNTREKIAEALKEIASKPRRIHTEVIPSTSSVILRLPEMDLFEPGTAVLTPQSIDYITTVATVLKDIPYPLFPVSIEGHTDAEAPLDGRYADGLELSTARAYAIYMAMFSGRFSTVNEYLRPEQFGVFGCGAPGQTAEEGLDPARRRRVDIVIHMDEYYRRYEARPPAL